VVRHRNEVDDGGRDGGRTRERTMATVRVKKTVGGGESGEEKNH